MSLLTSDEKELLEKLGSLANDFSWIARKAADETKAKHPWSPDLEEAVFHIHALQHIVMANAAARAYPEKFRLFGARYPIEGGGS